MAREGRILGGLALAVGLGTLVVLGAAVPARAQGTFPSVLNGIFADCSAAVETGCPPLAAKLSVQLCHRRRT